jgi:hypothetical protein
MGRETMSFVSADKLLCNACGEIVIYEREEDNPFKFWEQHKTLLTHKQALGK